MQRLPQRAGAAERRFRRTVRATLETGDRCEWTNKLDYVEGVERVV